MNETPFTIAGNLVADPEEVSTKRGGSFAKFRVAVNERRYDRTKGEFVDGTSSFYDVTAFNDLGHNVLSSLKSGFPVVVTGVMRISQWRTAEGETRYRPEITARHVGADLAFGFGMFQRTPRRMRALPPDPQPVPTDEQRWADQPAYDVTDFEVVGAGGLSGPGGPEGVASITGEADGETAEESVQRAG